MIELPIEVILSLSNVILVLAGLYLGGKYKEVKEALKVTIDAIQDNKITRKELKDMIKEWDDVIKIWK